MSSVSKKKTSRLGQIVRHQLAGSKWSLAWAGICTLGLTVTELARPWPLKVIFDNILLGKPLPRAMTFLHGLLLMGKTTAVVAVSSLIVVIALLRGLASPPSVTLQIVRSADPNVVEREWVGIEWRSSQYDVGVITGTLTVDDLATEEFPYVTFDGRFKGLWP